MVRNLLVPPYKYVFTRIVSDLVSYAPAANDGTIVLNLNSLYDPMDTNGTEQPLYYTEMSNLYGRYKVYSCKYLVTIFNTTGDLVEVAYVARFATGAPTDFREARQTGKTRVIGATDENISNKSLIKGLWSLKKHANESRADTTYSGLFGANPSALAKLYILLESSANVSVKYRVEMQFYCKLDTRVANASDDAGA